MHYLNDELWIIVEYLDTASWSSGSVKRYVIEVYSRKDRHFTRVQEIPLYKEDGETLFLGAKRRSRGEYTDRGCLHKNDKFIVWISGHGVNVFDRVSGKRVKKEHWNSTQHVVFYNEFNQKFSWMDCACYSFLYYFKLRAYDPMAQVAEDRSREVPLPIILD